MIDDREASVELNGKESSGSASQAGDVPPTRQWAGIRTGILVVDPAKTKRGAGRALNSLS
jgi:hypothetical protein